jgi:hypothetical protein
MRHCRVGDLWREGGSRQRLVDSLKEKFRGENILCVMAIFEIKKLSWLFLELCVKSWLFLNFSLDFNV